MAMMGDVAWNALDGMDLEKRDCRLWGVLLLQERVEEEGKRRGRRIILWRGILA
jgi:hypothetical protein